MERFIGIWGLRRVIAQADGGTARFTGTARFAPDAQGLIYVEEGQLCVPGQPAMTATRRYLWRAGAGGIDVFFDDGRFFHTITPGAAPRARHLCNPDTYDVAYDFSGWPQWWAEWRVKGPRKAYTMRSDYVPRRD